jgi:uncharacterized protein (TIGR00730 family)
VEERIISIFGSAVTPEDHPGYAEARQTGRRLAEAGFTVASGGYGGIMEAVSRGAKEGGGTVIGVTCGLFTARGAANAWVDREIFTPTLFERIETVINLAEGFIAFPGGPGTLAEVSITWNLLQRDAIPPSPLVLVGSNWRDLLSGFGQTPWVRDRDVDLLRFADSGEDAVREILDGHR